jgi:cbb3-type cytochrome oxidase maturation protein
MSALFLLIGISLCVAAGFLSAFLGAVRKGQFDDDRTPAVRMLFDPPTGKKNAGTAANPSDQNPE